MIELTCHGEKYLKLIRSCSGQFTLTFQICSSKRTLQFPTHKSPILHLLNILFFPFLFYKSRPLLNKHPLRQNQKTARECKYKWKLSQWREAEFLIIYKERNETRNNFGHFRPRCFPPPFCHRQYSDMTFSLYSALLKSKIELVLNKFAYCVQNFQTALEATELKFPCYRTKISICFSSLDRKRNIE